MPTLRFSSRSMFVAFACIGVVLTAFSQPTEWTAWLATRLYYIAIVAAPLGIIFRRGEARAFWIGFTILGWGLIVVGHWTGVGWTKLFDVPAEQLHQLYFGEPASDAVGRLWLRQPPRALRINWDAHLSLFLQIAASASALFLSITGGAVAVYLDRTKPTDEIFPKDFRRIECRCYVQCVKFHFGHNAFTLIKSCQVDSQNRTRRRPLSLSCVEDCQGFHTPKTMARWQP